MKRFIALLLALLLAMSLLASCGDASEEEKNTVSHRKRALESLCEKLSKVTDLK